MGSAPVRFILVRESLTVSELSSPERGHQFVTNRWGNSENSG